MRRARDRQPSRGGTPRTRARAGGGGMPREKSRERPSAREGVARLAHPRACWGGRIRRESFARGTVSPRGGGRLPHATRTRARVVSGHTSVERSREVAPTRRGVAECALRTRARVGGVPMLCEKFAHGCAAPPRGGRFAGPRDGSSPPELRSATQKVVAETFIGRSKASVRIWDFIRSVFGICAAAALLAGCGGSQPPIGAPGAMAQSSLIAAHVAVANRGAARSEGLASDLE